MAELEKCSKGYCDIPKGTFPMGSLDGDPDEQPVRNVTLSGFQLGQTEVSVGRYSAFLQQGNPGTELQALISGCVALNSAKVITARKGENRDQLTKRAAQFAKENWCKNTPVVRDVPKGMPAFPQNWKGNDYPVVGLLPDEMWGFCLADGGALPTAAQLHFASRYDEEDIPRDQRVIRENGFQSTEPVTANPKRKNRFGVFGLLDNVWESSRDAYDPQFYSRMGSENPHNPLTDQGGQFWEVSGGSYYSVPKDVRSENREGEVPQYRGFDNGFRCVR